MTRRAIRTAPRRAVKKDRRDHLGTCRWCGADIMWLKHPKTGKLAPIDLHPVPGGNIAVDTKHGTYTVISRDELTLFDTTRADEDANPNLHLNHYVTCSNVTARRLHRERGTTTAAADVEDVAHTEALDAPPDVVAELVPCVVCGLKLNPVIIREGHDRHPTC